jgi:hypothetical protein
MRRVLCWLILILYIAGVSWGKITTGLRSFNAGEVSPLMEARSDFNKYDNACRTLQNMLALSQGPVTRRPGTKYIAEVKTSSKGTRLISFEHSQADAYILEFGDQYMRVFRNGGVVVSAPSTPYELATVFEESELFELQYAQSADVMYLVHPNHPPQELSRTDHNDWSIAGMTFEYGPFQDENTSDVTINPSGTTGTITLVGSANLWEADDVNSQWRLSYRVAEQHASGLVDSGDGDDYSSVITVSGEYEFTTDGTWSGIMRLQRDEGDGYQNVVSARSVNNNNILYSDTETEHGVNYRVFHSITDGNCTYNLTAAPALVDGYVQITAYTDATHVTANVLRSLGSDGTTKRWAEGYWSDANGWPRTVAFHEQRLVFAGSTDHPQTMWASQVDDYPNMLTGNDDDDAIIYVIPNQNPIQWLISQENLFVGTLNGAGRLITPPDLAYKSQVGFGSAYIQAVQVSDAILYVENGGRRVREFLYSYERDHYLAPDMTILAEHITGDGIVDIAYQHRPDSVLWCVCSDGNMATLTYQREHDVVAWSRHITDGSFESVAVIPAEDEDEVWVVVNRTIDGNTVRYVEQFQPRDWGSDQADCFFLDSGLAYDGGAAVAITNVTQADPAVVTVGTWPTDGAGDNLVDGQQVQLLSVAGMTELNTNIYSINEPNVTAKTFQLRNSSDTADINSVGYTAYTSGGTAQNVENSFSGLDHLEGETAAVLADGNELETVTVSSGSVTISEWANKVHTGLPYTSTLETLPISIHAQRGTATAKVKRITSVVFSFYESLGTKYGVDSTDNEDVPFYAIGDTTTALKTGFVKAGFPYGYSRDTTIYLEHDAPLPLTVRAILLDVQVYER